MRWLPLREVEARKEFEACEDLCIFGSRKDGAWCKSVCAKAVEKHALLRGQIFYVPFSMTGWSQEAAGNEEVLETKNEGTKMTRNGTSVDKNGQLSMQEASGPRGIGRGSIWNFRGSYF